MRKKLKRKLTSRLRDRVATRSTLAYCKERRKPSRNVVWPTRAKWLLTGLAVAVSRKSWHMLSKHRTCAITPQWLLQVHFQHGYVSTEQDDAKKPYVAPYVQSLYEHTWEGLVTRIICKGYNEATIKFRTTREERDELEFYSTFDQTNPLEAPPEAGQGSQSQASSHSPQ